jgi:hypothetical protein
MVLAWWSGRLLGASYSREQKRDKEIRKFGIHGEPPSEVAEEYHDIVGANVKATGERVQEF